MPGEGRIDQDTHDGKGEPTPMLTNEQTQAYEEQGYLLVSGLIPAETAAEAEAAMWRLIEASPSEPAAWTGRPTVAQSYESPELLACFTPAYLAAATLWVVCAFQIGAAAVRAVQGNAKEIPFLGPLLTPEDWDIALRRSMFGILAPTRD